MGDSTPGPLRTHPLLKLMALAPPLLSGAAAVLLAATSPFAWGAADSAGMAEWVPTFTALVLALPVLLISLYGAREVFRRLSGLFEVDLRWALVGGSAHWIAAICLVIFAGTMGSSESYRSMGEDVTTAGIVFLTLVAASIGAILLAGLAMVYVWSISPGRQTRLGERSETEVDFVAEWGRRRSRR